MDVAAFFNRVTFTSCVHTLRLNARQTGTETQKQQRNEGEAQTDSSAIPPYANADSLSPGLPLERLRSA